MNESKEQRLRSFSDPFRREILDEWFQLHGRCERELFVKGSNNLHPFLKSRNTFYLISVFKRPAGVKKGFFKKKKVLQTDIILICSGCTKLENYIHQHPIHNGVSNVNI